MFSLDAKELNVSLITELTMLAIKACLQELGAIGDIGQVFSNPEDDLFIVTDQGEYILISADSLEAKKNEFAA